MENTLQIFMQSTRQFQQASQHSDLHPQCPQPFVQPQQPSLEDTLQMLIQNTMQFQQEIQTIIAKIKMQMGSLATSQSERIEEETFLSQPIINPIGQFKIEASSHNE